MKQKFNFEPRWFAIIIFFIVGLFLGGLVLFIWIFNGGRLYGIQKIHQSGGNYKFTNPLLAVNVDQPVQFLQTDNLKNQISALLDKSQKSGQLTAASFYFQDLESGRWFGLNEDLTYSPGKFLKVPIMIGYFKAAETDPTILQKQLVYTTQPGDTNTSNQVDLQEGESYPVSDFIKDMIIDDSDSSAIILFDNIDKNYLNEVYSDLGINYHEDKTSDDYINIKQSALFYRVLYNSTYLNPNYSEQALDIISRGDVGLGTALTLPNNITVAHRNRGRQIIQNSAKLEEVNDCGIIYYPGHPYILCGLAMGKNLDAVNNLFSQASQIVFKDMSERYKN
jgi:hypothetical protein